MPAVRVFHSSPRWYFVPIRVLLVTFIVALLSFAVTLLLGILGVLLAAKLRGLEPNLTIAYRGVALPAAAITAAMVLVFSTYMEIRSYRQSKTLEGIEHQMET
jgi:ABC-type dipeptide/oligopeptide/nickel transport system permease component